LRYVSEQRDGQTDIQTCLSKYVAPLQEDDVIKVCTKWGASKESVGEHKFKKFRCIMVQFKTLWVLKIWNTFGNFEDNLRPGRSISL